MTAGTTPAGRCLFETQKEERSCDSGCCGRCALPGTGGAVLYNSMANKAPSPAPTPTPPVQVGTMLGGWQVNESYQSVVTGQEAEMFAKAAAGDPSSTYEPVIVLAERQADDAADYAVLSFRVQTEGDPESHFALTSIRSGKYGSAAMLSSNDIDPNAVKTIDAVPEGKTEGLADSSFRRQRNHDAGRGTAADLIRGSEGLSGKES